MNGNQHELLKETKLPSPKELRKSILNLNKPLVIKSCIKNWLISKWTLQDWTSALGSEKLPFRIGTRECTKNPQWEGSCKIEECSLKDFLAFTEKGEKQKWMYFDYKYMNEWFENHPTILKSVSWAPLGFPEVKGEDSTIWLGSKGAHTPCHMDSYSLNLVAQLHGKKAWLLFPPDDVDSLQPTRVPYEESSVFSKLNFSCRKSLKGFKEAHFVILSPGDVLVVPNGWWHYVENIETSISINTWIPLDIDDEKRLEECLVRTFIGSLIENIGEEESRYILNPNEVHQMEGFKDSSIEMINLCVNNVKRSREENGRKLLEQQTISESCLIKFVQRFAVDDIAKSLPCLCNDSTNDEFDSRVTVSPPEEMRLENVINAFCHPDVISKVKEKLMLNIDYSEEK